MLVLPNPEGLWGIWLAHREPEHFVSNKNKCNVIYFCPGVFLESFKRDLNEAKAVSCNVDNYLLSSVNISHLPLCNYDAPITSQFQRTRRSLLVLFADKVFGFPVVSHITRVSYMVCSETITSLFVWLLCLYCVQLFLQHAPSRDEKTFLLKWNCDSPNEGSSTSLWLFFLKVLTQPLLFLLCFVSSKNQEMF